jgi:hypothetical protein
MTLKTYAIRDAKAEVFNTPFYQKTHGEAERSFKQLVSDAQSMVSKFPDDYDLYYLGEYDDQTGKLHPIDTPQHIVKAVQLQQQKTVSPGNQ